MALPVAIAERPLIQAMLPVVIPMALASLKGFPKSKINLLRYPNS
jgi:hypothetical protein